MERAAITRVIRDYAKALQTSRKPEAPVEAARDPVTLHAALEEACRDHGVTLDEYDTALQEDPSLSDLARQATTASVVETPDPGPYDAISRESPSGQPGNLEKYRSVPRREAPGGS